MWTDVSNRLPLVIDECLYRSDEVLCQDGDGNIFIGYVRYDRDRELDPLWTHSGRDMYDLDGIVKWISLKDVSKILDEWGDRTQASRKHLALLELLRKRGGSGECPEKNCPGALAIDGACNHCGDTWATNIIEDATDAFADGLEFENISKNAAEDGNLMAQDGSDMTPCKMSGQMSVRFECGWDDRIGPVLGPYEWVHLTYGTLRAKLPNHEKEIDLAYITNDEWIHDDDVWSDVVIFSASDAQKDGE